MTFGAMRWSDLLFVHWKADAERLAERLPAGLALDHFEGQAYVSLVALQAVGPLPHPLLVSAFAPLFRYHQVNLRTYVVGDEGPGMLLLDTRVDRPFAVAARAVGMPYHLDRRLALHLHAGAIVLRSSLADLEGSWVADAAPAAPEHGGLAAFLLERARTYAVLPGGALYTVEVQHAPWRVRPVYLANAPLAHRFGLGGSPPISSQLAEPVDVTFAALHKVARHAV